MAEQPRNQRQELVAGEHHRQADGQPVQGTTTETVRQRQRLWFHSAPVRKDRQTQVLREQERWTSAPALAWSLKHGHQPAPPEIRDTSVHRGLTARSR
jgi:hypothetical protein